jgi:hypothetical protein
MIPTNVLRAGLAQMVPEWEARQVIEAQGGSAHRDGGSQLLLNRLGGGGCDGWYWDYSARGIGFGLAPFRHELWIGALRVIAAILTVATEGEREHGAFLDRLVEMLIAPEEASGQLSLLDGAS